MHLNIALDMHVHRNEYFKHLQSFFEYVTFCLIAFVVGGPWFEVTLPANVRLLTDLVVCTSLN